MKYSSVIVAAAVGGTGAAALDTPQTRLLGKAGKRDKAKRKVHELQSIIDKLTKELQQCNEPNEAEASFQSISQDLGLAQCLDLEEDTFIDPTFYAQREYGNQADASIRGFEIETLIGDELLPIFNGDIDPPAGSSEAVEIFRTLVELHNQGVTYSAISDAMSGLGYDEKTIQTALSDATLIRNDFEIFMNGLAEEEILDSLSDQDEDDVIANSGSVDAFGNAVVVDAEPKTTNSDFFGRARKLNNGCSDAKKPGKFPGGIGPGFQIRNDTPWPVEVSLWQVGPLYWQLLQPGQVFSRDTGSVWFTVKATVNYDNKPSINTRDAIWPVAIVTGSILLAMVTLGASAKFSAGVTVALTTGVSTSTAASIAAYLVGLGFTKGAAIWITAAGSGVLTGLTATGAQTGVREAVASELKVLENYNSVLSAGVYAGYAWPFREATQQITITRGLFVESVSVDNECGILINNDKSGPLRFNCVGGDCYV